jgi:hypothetical protein
LAKYEAAQIEAGVAIDEPTFYDAFHNQHGSIAVSAGPP